MTSAVGIALLVADVATAPPTSQAFARRRADAARSLPGVTPALEFSTAPSVEPGHDQDHADNQRQPTDDENHDSHHDIIPRVQFPRTVRPNSSTAPSFGGRGFAAHESGTPRRKASPKVGRPAMEKPRIASATPKDATESTEDQRRLQEKFDHRDDDPDAPGGHQSRHQISDET
jgi:hypothetical protein